MNSRVKQNQDQLRASSAIGKAETEHREKTLGGSLQRAVGNQGMRRLFGNLKSLQAVPAASSTRSARLLRRKEVSPRLQTKLAVNAPGDSFEQEADRVAERVMRMPESQVQRKCACDGDECSKCQNEKSAPEQVQTKRVDANFSGETVAPPSVDEVLHSLGQPLDSTTREFMESRFGYDFSKVRVHADPKAAESAHAVHALAYTVGPNVVFGTGQYSPGTSAGRRLLAHELTHAVQQGAVTSKQSNQSVDKPGNRHESRATAAKYSAPARKIDPSPETQVIQRFSQTVMMRSPLPFSSTVNICHDVLKSRNFTVSKGGVKVSIEAYWQGP